MAWSSGLFDCFNDCGICIYGYCCPPCLYGENAQKIDGSSCFGSCFVWCLLADCGLCCLVHMGKREALRRRYGLEENCNDCLATTFCATCAMCQEARELKYRENTTSYRTTTSTGYSASSPVVVQPMAASRYQSPEPQTITFGVS